MRFNLLSEKLFFAQVIFIKFAYGLRNFPAPGAAGLALSIGPRIEVLMKHAITVAVCTLFICAMVSACGGGGGSGASVNKLTIVGSGS